MNPTKLALLVALTGFVAACGGGSSDSGAVAAAPPAPSPPPASPSADGTGKFIDSEVVGLDYDCGGVTGVTDSLGQFQYLSGKNCTFSIGGITLGSAVAAPLLYPVSLVPGAEPGVANAAVTDIARLLQSLDDDADPSNGIVISAAVRAALATATLAAPFGDPGFAAAAGALVGAALPGRALVDATAAAAHLDLSLVNLWSGGYQCKYYADVGGAKTELGNVAISIAEGVITGTGTPTYGGGGSPFEVGGSVSASGSAALNAAGGATSTGATFEGTFTSDGTAAGTGAHGSWSDPGIAATGTTWDCQHD
ncbi:MAG: hypothetical protein ABT20_14055 [Rubrivivax sp. SCN 70-15]|nr:MAG: hypothetical protein ABT20_14055 [Rubrivivax sp. SCN 70-15]